MKTPPKLPIQGAQDRSKRRVTERDKGIEPMSEVHATGDYQLDKKVIDALRAAQGQHPLVVRNAIPQEALMQIATAWEDFVANDEEEYDTNEGPSTDDIERTRCRGPQLLRRVWDKPWRTETNLKKKKRARRGDQDNPVIKFLKDPKYKYATKGTHLLHQRVKRYAKKIAGRNSEIVEPSFVTGKIRKGVKDGDPCTTHQDTYENYAMILLGRKIFYTAKPPTFEDESKWRGSGEENERPKARPLDHMAKDTPTQWRQADLRPGDLLYLPTSWWHAVLSNKHTIMTNVWTSQR